MGHDRLTCLSIQRLLQVRDQVVYMLQPDRDAQQVGGRVAVGAFDRGAVLDEAFHPPEAGGAREHFHLGGYGHRFRGPALDLHRQHAAIQPHLPGGNSMAGMVGQPGIVHGGDGRMTRQEPGDGAGIPAWARMR